MFVDASTSRWYSAGSTTVRTVNRRCWGFKSAVDSMLSSRLTRSSGLLGRRLSGVKGTRRYFHSSVCLSAGIRLPRQLNVWDASTTVFFCFGTDFSAIEKHFDSLTRNPHSYRNSAEASSKLWRPVGANAKRTMSSAYLMAFTMESPTRTPISLRSLEKSRSITRLKIIGESGSPCFTPHVGCITRDFYPSHWSRVTKL